MSRIVFLLVVMLSGSSLAVPPLAIHRDDLGEFALALERARCGKKYVLTNPEEAFLLVGSETRGSRLFPSYREVTRLGFFAGFRECSGGPFDLGRSNRVLIPLNDLFGHERAFHALSIWEAREDSLLLRHIVPELRTGGLGCLHVYGVRPLPDGTAIVVLETRTTLEDDIPATLEIVSLDPITGCIHTVHSASWHYVYMTRSDTLRCEIVDEPGRLGARLIREQIDFPYTDRPYTSRSFAPDTTWVPFAR